MSEYIVEVLATTVSDMIKYEPQTVGNKTVMLCPGCIYALKEHYCNTGNCYRIDYRPVKGIIPLLKRTQILRRLNQLQSESAAQLMAELLYDQSLNHFLLSDEFINIVQSKLVRYHAAYGIDLIG